MPDTRPVAAAKPIVLTFRYDVDDAFIERWIDEHGEQPSKRWTIDVDLRDVDTPEARRAARRAHDIVRSSGEVPLLSEPTPSAEAVVTAILMRHDAKLAERQRVEAEKKAAKETQAVEQALFMAETSRWVQQHGSEHLKLAFAREYVVTRLYGIERVRREFPGAWVDFGNAAVWNARANPSPGALALEQVTERRIASAVPDSDGLSTRIIWLMEYPRDMERFLEARGIESEAVEAIWIGAWLGRYHLLLPVEQMARAPVEGGAS